ncbi:MAG: inorganic phosphate transporter [Thermodesulfovibrio sp.]|uniref:inorganic phosphate transporter n=1 Tax=unclassified Thermodesulfovibrio TaxID=2645936 RepID=UPI00083A426B|nr:MULTISPECIES: inorganic phosphate transporter [unclassified Thermodesulfovibrio]MDI1471220.1 inorganic phosphate transporter [Thermodesulfovibrio sp. 1176]MDI6715304.1 inorganic phosphate transporter [Thermodesulfovibrio sp.]ODA44163.1 putative low-affinity inorganic phosphate transporter [Thermodesulfovibrio sp. N1]
MIEIAVATSFLIAFGIGSNDASNALSICVGAGIIRLRRAILLFGGLVFLGIMLQGSQVMKTVGKNLVDVNITIIIVAMTVSASLIIFSNWRKLPLSTHQVIIGSLIGSALAAGVNVNFNSFLKIVISWVISPFVAVGFSYLFYKIIEKILSKFSFFQIEKILRILLLLSGFLISYNTGANELATVLGPVIHSNIGIDKIYLFLIGSLMVFMGAILLSHRVIETVGKGITTLDPFSGFAAQFGAGCCVLFFTFLGMPISTTYCIIGGITGVGLTKGIKTVKLSLLRKIALNFITTPSIAFVISYIVLKLIYS